MATEGFTDLERNEEYGKAEKRLNEALETFKKVLDNAELYSEELGASCAEAIKSIREFRRSVDEALGQMEADMIEKVEAIKAEQMKELAALGKKYRAPQEELQSAMGKVEALQQSGQNCSVFTEMMRINEKLAALDAEINEAVRDTYGQKPQVLFSPNKDTLEMMKQAATFGNIAVPVRQRKIVQAGHAQDLNVSAGNDNERCCSRGLVVLHDGKLVLTDTENSSVKVVSLQSDKVLSSLKLPRYPNDICAISSNKVAVTIPTKQEVAIIAVGDLAMRIDSTIAVNGECEGVDYRNGKFAVSFSDPEKVEVLSLQGSVLHTLSTDELGNDIFWDPFYLTYGQDDSTLYVSNAGNNTVVCLKLEGTVVAVYTVVATYTDQELENPQQLVVASNGDLLVCARDSHTVHQINKDCKKIRVLLNQADGLENPYSMCLSEEKGMIYVGMFNNDIVKVYKIEQEP